MGEIEVRFSAGITILGWMGGEGRVKGYEFNNFNRRGSNIKHKVLLFKHTKRDIKMVTSRVGKKDSLFS